MSLISTQTFEQFFSALPDAEFVRFAPYQQDFNTLAADGSLEYRELLAVLNSDAAYDKKRLAYAIIQKCFPNEAAGVSAPQPSVWDSLATAVGTAVDHYVEPAPTALSSVSGFVSYLNPLQAYTDGLDAAMKDDFEAASDSGNSQVLDLTYDAAYLPKHGVNAINKAVSGVAALVDLPVYGVTATVSLVWTAGKDYFSDADAVTPDDYLAAGENAFGYNGAKGVVDYGWNAIKLGWAPAITVYDSIVDPNTTGLVTYAGNYHSHLWDNIIEPAKVLSGWDSNNPDTLDNIGNVGSTAGAFAVGGEFGPKILPKGILKALTKEIRGTPRMPWKVFTDARAAAKAKADAQAAAEAKATAEAKAKAAEPLPPAPKSALAILADVYESFTAETAVNDPVSIMRTANDTLNAAEKLQKNLDGKTPLLTEAQAELPRWLELEKRLKTLAGNTPAWSPLITALDQLIFELERQGFYNKKPWLAGEDVIKDFSRRAMRYFRALKQSRPPIVMDPTAKPVVITATATPTASLLEGQSYQYTSTHVDVAAESTSGGPAWKLRLKPSQDSFALAQGPDGTVSLVVTDGGSTGANGHGAGSLASHELAQAYQNGTLPADAFSAAHIAIYSDLNFISTDPTPSFAVATSVSVAPDLTVTLARVGDSQAVAIRDGAVLDAGDLRDPNRTSSGVSSTLGGGGLTPSVPLQKTFAGIAGDIIIAASDHFWELVKVEDILAAVKRCGDDIVKLQNSLTSLAYVRNNLNLNSRMSLTGDNLTVGIMRLKDPSAVASPDPIPANLAPTGLTLPPTPIDPAADLSGHFSMPPYLVDPVADRPLPPPTPMQVNAPEPPKLVTKPKIPDAPHSYEVKLGTARNNHVTTVNARYPAAAVYTYADPAHPLRGALEVIENGKTPKFKLTAANGQEKILNRNDIIAIRDARIDLTECYVLETITNPSVMDQQVITIVSHGNTNHLVIDLGDVRVAPFFRKFDQLRAAFQPESLPTETRLTYMRNAALEAWERISSEIRRDTKPQERVANTASTIGDIISAKIALQGERLILWQLAMQYIGIHCEMILGTDAGSRTTMRFQLIDDYNPEDIEMTTITVPEDVSRTTTITDND